MADDGMERWHGYIQLSNKYRTVAKMPETELTGLELLKRDDPLKYQRIEKSAAEQWLRSFGERNGCHQTLSFEDFKAFKVAAEYWLGVEIVESRLTRKGGP